MKRNYLVNWITLAGVIGLAFGIFYAFFGLEGLPVYDRLVPAESFKPWKNGLYGSVFIGFSILLLLIGRHALQKDDKPLMKMLMYGIGAWIGVEALFSALYGVYFNLLVDVVLLGFLLFPLAKGVHR